MLLVGCGNQSNNLIAVSAAENVTLDSESKALPQLTAHFENGKQAAADYNDFWYHAENVYVQDGRVRAKANAPAIFTDTLTVISKHNSTIATTVRIEKPYIQLEDITLRGENGETTIFPGSSLRIFTSFEPTNAIDKQVTYSIVEGDATISTSGNLHAQMSAEMGSIIKVKAVVNTELKEVVSYIEIAVRQNIPIYTAEDFIAISENPDVDYSLEANIDISEYSDFFPIPIFNGTLRGKGRTISGLEIAVTGGVVTSNLYYGIFGQVTGTIYNLNIENCAITFTQTSTSNLGSGRIYAGILAGMTSGNLAQIKVYDSAIEVFREEANVGGITGMLSGQMEACSASSIFVKGNGNIGGLVGYLDAGVISDASLGRRINYNTIWHISIYKAKSCGGIVGYATNSEISSTTVGNTNFILEGSDVKTAIGYIVGFIDGDGTFSRGGIFYCNQNRSKAGTEWRTYYFKELYGYIGRVSRTAKVS